MARTKVRVTSTYRPELYGIEYSDDQIEKIARTLGLSRSFLTGTEIVPPTTDTLINLANQSFPIPMRCWAEAMALDMDKLFLDLVKDATRTPN
jgi:hypothetical protein